MGMHYTFNALEMREYWIWVEIKRRCKSRKDYKGRGITVCARWISSFEDFLADMGKSPKNFTIERLDNDKGYEPRNCVWASRKQQGNNRRSNRIIEFKGVRKTLTAWAESLSMSPFTLAYRLNNGWSVEEALNYTLKTRRQVCNRSSKRMLEFKGAKKPLSSWAKTFGMSQFTLRWRLDNGWSLEDALTTAVRAINNATDCVKSA